MNNWFSFWNEPHPDTTDFGYKLKELLVISLGIAAFLYFFKPFGWGAYQGNHFLLALGFGGVTFACGVVFEFVLAYVLKIKKDLPTWTYGKWLLSTLVLILLIALGNFLLLKWLFGDRDWMHFPIMVFYTFLLGLFPISIGGLFKQNRALKENQLTAASIQPGETAPSQANISFQNGKEKIEIAQETLLYLESMQNYVAIHFHESGLPKKTLIRSTLKDVAQYLPKEFMLCHRSFIVHLNQIQKVEGNAQGLKLHLKDSDVIIPVSRKYIAELRSHLSQNA